MAQEQRLDRSSPSTQTDPKHNSYNAGCTTASNGVRLGQQVSLLAVMRDLAINY